MYVLSPEELYAIFITISALPKLKHTHDMHDLLWMNGLIGNVVYTYNTATSHIRFVYLLICAYFHKRATYFTTKYTVDLESLFLFVLSREQLYVFSYDIVCVFSFRTHNSNDDDKTRV